MIGRAARATAIRAGTVSPAAPAIKRPSQAPRQLWKAAAREAARPRPVRRSRKRKSGETASGALPWQVSRAAAREFEIFEAMQLLLERDDCDSYYEFSMNLPEPHP